MYELSNSIPVKGLSDATRLMQLNISTFSELHSTGHCIRSNTRRGLVQPTLLDSDVVDSEIETETIIWYNERPTLAQPLLLVVSDESMVFFVQGCCRCCSIWNGLACFTGCKVA